MQLPSPHWQRRCSSTPTPGMAFDPMSRARLFTSVPKSRSLHALHKRSADSSSQPKATPCLDLPKCGILNSRLPSQPFPARSLSVCTSSHAPSGPESAELSFQKRSAMLQSRHCGPCGLPHGTATRAHSRSIAVWATLMSGPPLIHLRARRTATGSLPSCWSRHDRSFDMDGQSGV